MRGFSQLKVTFSSASSMSQSDSDGSVKNELQNLKSKRGAASLLCFCGVINVLAPLLVLEM